MKKIIPLLLLSLCLHKAALSQSQYEVYAERPGEKTMKGIISREILLSDTSFTWYAENLKNYTPNARALEGLRKQKDSVQLLVFMGTWCEDSHNIIPKLFSLADAAGFPESHITLVGVDRSKKTLSHLAEALGVVNVPTIIVLKKGKEAGRVVEFGKYGLFDLELGEILESLN